MTKNHLPVQVLTASEAHTLGVLDLAKLIWDGTDYVPQVWNDWLTDPEGRMVVAEYGDRVVGLGKLSRISPVDWWLEGLRVHPEFAGRGVAQQIYDALVETWERVGSGTVRFMTASNNKAVHHMSAQRGFQLTGKYTFFSGPTRLTEQENQVSDHGFALTEAPTLPFHPLLAGEDREASAFARSAESTALTGELIELEWRYAPARPEHFTPYIQEHRAWWWRGHQGLLAIYLDTDDDESPEHPHLSLVACPMGQLHPFLIDIRRLYEAMGYQKVEWIARLEPALEEILSAAGFNRTWEHAMWVFEKTTVSQGPQDSTIET